MGEQTHERIEIRATPAQCWAVAVDVAHYPDWAKDVKEAKVVDLDADGRPARAEFRVAAMGRSIHYVLEYDYSDAPRSFGWKLVEGDMLRQLDGSYSFEADGDVTRVTYDLAVDITMPLPGLIKRRAAGLITGNALKELKKAVERDSTVGRDS
ncbi:MAG: Polyketide cyclase / dehydrase and lipid transport [Actinomycetia bacterium]|nr:Polyketide cyclase / dehydrase and lipid transport [Actinomycetes bacterium]